MLIFVVWFGVVKVRNQYKLGTLAGALRLFEILGAVGAAAAVLVLAVALANIEQPGMNQQEIDQAMNAMVEHWTRAGVFVQALAMTCWAILTALLFTALRNRFEPEQTLEPLAG